MRAFGLFALRTGLLSFREVSESAGQGVLLGKLLHTDTEFLGETSEFTGRA